MVGLLQSSVSHSFSCGIISGIFASVVTHPADVVKTSMQLFPSRYRHDPLRRIFKDQGFSGFFVGLLPRLVRLVRQFVKDVQPPHEDALDSLHGIIKEKPGQ